MAAARAPKTCSERKISFKALDRRAIRSSRRGGNLEVIKKADNAPPASAAIPAAKAKGCYSFIA
jgi:hypothetical protein